MVDTNVKILRRLKGTIDDMSFGIDYFPGDANIQRFYCGVGLDTASRTESFLGATADNEDTRNRYFGIIDRLRNRLLLHYIDTREAQTQ